ncbi:MAG: hypothetical protein PHU03_04600, partial [Syntrophales bacterium]|nr:hypothetical protein [Syntrophales bacterium]
MLKILKTVFLVGIILSLMAGCMSRASRDDTSTPAPEEDNGKLRLIAILPVDNKTGDERAAEIVRDELLQRISF